ncbi:GTPase-activating protein gyp8 [Collariella sp. IMI 366227]|nr:GTPase-activating protein gyp8 [Collariella sp. IMI 366227]
MEEPIEASLNEKAANYNGSADAVDEKKEVILEACRQRDLVTLRALAESRGGFLTDAIRQQAWPILLGVLPSHEKSETEQDGTASPASWESLPHHKDEDQVQLDVNRAFIYYPDKPFFALSGTLTMYAHDITSQGEIARLFDVLLAREPVFTVYLFAAMVCARREELFDTPRDEPEMLHSILSKLPTPLDLRG